MLRVMRQGREANTPGLPVRLAGSGLIRPGNHGGPPVLDSRSRLEPADGRAGRGGRCGSVTGSFHSVWIGRRALPHRPHGTCRFPVGRCVPPARRGAKALKNNDDDSSPTGLGPGEQRLVAVVRGSRVDWPESSSPARPIGTEHRGGCLEGTRCAGPVGSRHARRGRTSRPGRACAGLGPARTDLLSWPPCACAGRLAGVPEDAPEMKKAPQRGASQSNSIGLLSVRMTCQILWTLMRDRRCGTPASGHLTYGARR